MSRPTIYRPSDRPSSVPAPSRGRGGVSLDPDFDADESIYAENMSRFERSADRVLSRRVPYGDMVQPWEPQISVHRRYMAHPPQEPERKELFGDVSRQALQILVGDLAPQVEGGLNFVANNEAAKSAVAFAGVGLAALVLPRLMK